MTGPSTTGRAARRDAAPPVAMHSVAVDAAPTDIDDALHVARTAGDFSATLHPDGSVSTFTARVRHVASQVGAVYMPDRDTATNVFVTEDLLRSSYERKEATLSQLVREKASNMDAVVAKLEADHNAAAARASARVAELEKRNEELEATLLRERDGFAKQRAHMQDEKNVLGANLARLQTRYDDATHQLAQARRLHAVHEAAIKKNAEEQAAMVMRDMQRKYQDAKGGARGGPASSPVAGRAGSPTARDNAVSRSASLGQSMAGSMHAERLAELQRRRQELEQRSQQFEAEVGSPDRGSMLSMLSTADASDAGQADTPTSAATTPSASTGSTSPRRKSTMRKAGGGATSPRGGSRLRSTGAAVMLTAKSPRRATVAGPSASPPPAQRRATMVKLPAELPSRKQSVAPPSALRRVASERKKSTVSLGGSVAFGQMEDSQVFDDATSDTASAYDDGARRGSSAASGRRDSAAIAAMGEVHAQLSLLTAAVNQMPADELLTLMAQQQVAAQTRLVAMTARLQATVAEFEARSGPNQYATVEAQVKAAMTEVRALYEAQFEQLRDTMKRREAMLNQRWGETVRHAEEQLADKALAAGELVDRAKAAERTAQEAVRASAKAKAECVRLVDELQRCHGALLRAQQTENTFRASVAAGVALPKVLCALCEEATIREEINLQYEFQRERHDRAVGVPATRPAPQQHARTSPPQATQHAASASTSSNPTPAAPRPLSARKSSGRPSSAALPRESVAQKWDVDPESGQLVYTPRQPATAPAADGHDPATVIRKPTDRNTFANRPFSAGRSHLTYAARVAAAEVSPFAPCAAVVRPADGQDPAALGLSSAPVALSARAPPVKKELSIAVA